MEPDGEEEEEAAADSVVGWDDLPLEVLQLICRHSTWRSLCHLEAVGCRLLTFSPAAAAAAADVGAPESEPAGEGGEAAGGDSRSVDERLGLTEAAAKRMALADPLLRSSARRPGESWKFVCAMLDVGVYRKGVLGRAAAKPFLLPQRIVEQHWIVAYNAQYDHRTQDEDLERVPGDARDVLVAAVPWRNPNQGQQGRQEQQEQQRLLSLGALAASGGGGGGGGGTAGSGRPADIGPAELYLAAWGPRDVVLRETHDPEEFRGQQTTTENKHEDVYFYRWAGSSFGFTAHPSLHLWKADAGARNIE
jgi:hypothetical protein